MLSIKKKYYETISIRIFLIYISLDNKSGFNTKSKRTEKRGWGRAGEGRETNNAEANLSIKCNIGKE